MVTFYNYLKVETCLSLMPVREQGQGRPFRRSKSPSRNHSATLTSREPAGELSLPVLSPTELNQVKLTEGLTIRREHLHFAVLNRQYGSC